MGLTEEEVIDAVDATEEGDGEHDGRDATVDVAECLDAEVVTHLVDQPGDEQPPA